MNNNNAGNNNAFSANSNRRRIDGYVLARARST